MVEHNLLEVGDGQKEGSEAQRNGDQHRHNINTQNNNNNTILSPSSDGSGFSSISGSGGFCAGCGGRIVDRYYLCTVDRPWHIHCLRCSDCRAPLDTEATCFAKDGSIYCKEDYYKRFATKNCARCCVTITASELVIRARDNVYHLGCFTCVTCQKVLTTGEHYGVRDGHVFCHQHYDQGSVSPPTPCGSPPEYMDTHMSPPNNQQLLPHAPFYNGVGATSKPGRPRKRKNQAQSHSNGDPGNLSLVQCDPDAMAFTQDGYPMQGSSRQKRMRTSFKHQQLRIMKSYFTLNHNPDAKDLAQLSQKTGLAKRVLQVWFQNARAKHRRMMVRKENGQKTDDLQEHSPGGSSQDNSTCADDNLTDMPKSPALSDISSSASMSDIHNSSMSEHAHAHEQQQQQQQQQTPQNSSLAELYNTMNSIG